MLDKPTFESWENAPFIKTNEYSPKKAKCGGLSGKKV